MNVPVIPMSHHMRLAAADRLGTIERALEKALTELGTLERASDEMLHDEEGRRLLAIAAVAVEQARVHFGGGR